MAEQAPPSCLEHLTDDTTRNKAHVVNSISDRLSGEDDEKRTDLRAPPLNHLCGRWSRHVWPLNGVALIVVQEDRNTLLQEFQNNDQTRLGMAFDHHTIDAGEGTIANPHRHAPLEAIFRGQRCACFDELANLFQIVDELLYVGDSQRS